MTIGSCAAKPKTDTMKKTIISQSNDSNDNEGNRRQEDYSRKIGVSNKISVGHQIGMFGGVFWDFSLKSKTGLLTISNILYEYESGYEIIII